MLIPVFVATPMSAAGGLEASAGILAGGGSRGFIGSVGPVLIFGFWENRMSLRFGISPTVISRDDYGDEELGGPIQFTSHIGLAVRIYRGVDVGYRLQHMSNAGLYNRNPGLNLHMIEISWRF